MRLFKSVIPFMVVLGLMFVISDVPEVSARADTPLPNSKFLAEVDSLRFAVTGQAVDTLISTVAGDSTTTVGIQGVDSAILHVLIYTEESDQTDSVEVNIAVAVIDSGSTRRYSGFVPVDTILVTQTDDTYTVHSVDLLKASVGGSLDFDLEDVAEFRFRFDGMMGTTADTLHVKSYLDRVWEVSPRR